MLGAAPQIPKTVPPLQIFGYALESKHAFACFYATRTLPNFTFKSINFYQNKPKIKLFLQNNKIFRVLGAPPLDLQYSLSLHCRFFVTCLI